MKDTDTWVTLSLTIRGATTNEQTDLARDVESYARKLAKRRGLEVGSLTDSGPT